IPVELDAVTASELVNISLQMRPERFILDELRGSEVLTVLQALASAQRGWLAAITAKDFRNPLLRLEPLAMLAVEEPSIKSVRQLICSAFDIVVVVSRLAGNVRKVAVIAEFLGMEQDFILAQELFHFDR